MTAEAKKAKGCSVKPKAKTRAQGARVGARARPEKTPKKEVSFDPATDLQVTTGSLKIMRIQRRNDEVCPN